MPDEIQMKGAYRNFSNIEFVEFILDNTGLKNWKCIGNSENGRPLYKIY